MGRISRFSEGIIRGFLTDIRTLIIFK